jgi:hypothetical protein
MNCAMNQLSPTGSERLLLARNALPDIESLY